MGKRETIKFLLVIDMISYLFFMLIGVSGILTNNRITDLERKIEELEKSNLEVHEYILDRIGG